MLALVAGMFGAWTERAAAESHPIWQPGLGQAVVGSFGRGMPPKDVAALVKLVSPYLPLTDGALAREIGSLPGGAADEEGIRESAAAVYNLALLFSLTRNRDYGRRAAVLLRAYADMFPLWRYEVCRAKCGIWTGWYHADFDVSRNLALAFDLLAPAGVFAELGTKVESRVRELLVQIVRADLEFPLYTMNWAFFRPLGLVIYGRVLDDPELVHLGYWFLSKLIHESYTQDGFLAEGTYSYHSQMTEPLLSPIQAFYLDGYSDPKGYSHLPFERRWDPARIEDFSLQRIHGAALERMAYSLRETALPNGEWPILNETKHYGQVRARPAEGSFLFSGLGHAVLVGGSGGGRAQARLDFSPSLSHQHQDALNLIFFDKGNEVVGGTAYRFPDREWNRSTLSQNLVVVDRAMQKGEYFVDWTMSPYVPGDPERRPVTRQLWNADKENLHNDVRLWVPGNEIFDAVQVVEVDATDAYRHVADRYLRGLVMVEVGAEDHYLVDVFRVRGGAEYHWLLHGGHARNELTTTLSMAPSLERLGRIALTREITTSEPWTARFAYPDGTYGSVSMIGVPGTTVAMGDGPRYEFGGTQPHLVVRRAAERTNEEVFFAVHEAYRDSPEITSIESLEFESGDRSTVGLRIALRNGAVDYVVHALESRPHTTMDPHSKRVINTNGRVTHIRTRGEAVEWMFLVEGARIRFGAQELVASSAPGVLKGAVTRVERREAGAERDAFVVDRDFPDSKSLVGRSLHVTWGNGWVWVYRIEEIVGNRIAVSGEPGFDYAGDTVDMQYFPVQEYLGQAGFPGPVGFHIPNVSSSTAPILPIPE